MNAIELTHVTVAYGRNEVVHDLSLAIPVGQLCGIVGPNGSGKSTLLKTINGVVEPRAGSVQVTGRPLARMGRREIARMQAVVPQETVVAFPFSVGEIVSMGRAPHLGALQFEGTEDLAAVRRALEVTDTLQFADRLLSELSGGEKQRVVIARAIAQEAPQMLLDEPTSFLDLKHQLTIYELIGRLRKRSDLTVVVVSHDVNLAAQHCDRLVMLKAGRIYADGSPAEVLTKDNILAVYDTQVVVAAHPHTAAPWVMPYCGGE